MLKYFYRCTGVICIGVFKEVIFMKANSRALKIEMARACMDTEDLVKAAEMPRPTVNKVLAGRSVRPGTLGRIARALRVDVTKIMEEVSV